MNSGFVKLFRQVKGHWVASRSDWFQGWTYILMSTNYETGSVDLTEVYRELSGIFDNRAWRYLIEKLEKDGMLRNVSAFNRGSKVGFKQTAIVTNWLKYHEGQEKDMSQPSEDVAHKSRGALRGERITDRAEQPIVRDEENGVVARSQRGASAEHYAESNKNTFQEVKEELASAHEKIKKTKAYKEVAYASSHYVAEWLLTRGFNFQRAYDVWGEQLEALAKAASNAPKRRPKDQMRFRFQDACERNLDLGLEPPTPQPPPAEPDENGLIIGETYWHARLHQPVLLLNHIGGGDYMADTAPPDSGISGPYNAVMIGDLEPYRPTCAA